MCTTSIGSREREKVKTTTTNISYLMTLMEYIGTCWDGRSRVLINTGRRKREEKKGIVVGEGIDLCVEVLVYLHLQ